MTIPSGMLMNSWILVFCVNMQGFESYERNPGLMHPFSVDCYKVLLTQLWCFGIRLIQIPRCWTPVPRLACQSALLHATAINHVSRDQGLSKVCCRTSLSNGFRRGRCICVMCGRNKWLYVIAIRYRTRIKSSSPTSQDSWSTYYQPARLAAPFR